MSSENELERHLLSRSYEDPEEIEDLLDNRYSHHGSQKPVLVFGGLQTRGATEAVSIHKIGDKQAKKRRVNARTSVKSYITRTLAAQSRLCRSLQRDQPVDVATLRKYKIPTFEEFLPMNNLWQGYASDLIKENGKYNESMALQRLSSADFHGCLLSVTKAANPELVGVRGIVVWDSQHSFVMVVPRGADAKPWSSESDSFSRSERVGGLRMIPKKGTIFELDVLNKDVEVYSFVIYGSRFEVRSVERSGRKFKPHSVDDL
ncbi:hypothetical protein DIURU_004433 [Diutina rugosa]|uniref:Ribonuclease P protein subunit n=1 Tax=Diutina rugosa TaxID=5481 RepID=A0A642UHH2_DIURU|nr:uncharacterized protein DIURU_004433 [Diutina rugosa]KAA8899052.1 hypothetical protein DIURU_004433 [Diutina rugosa]